MSLTKLIAISVGLTDTCANLTSAALQVNSGPGSVLLNIKHAIGNKKGSKDGHKSGYDSPRRDDSGPRQGTYPVGSSGSV